MKFQFTMGLVLSLFAAQVSAVDISGWASFEAIGFVHQGQDPDQRNNSVSFALQPEFFVELEGGKNSFLFVPFYRFDGNDKARTHADIRELKWTFIGDDEWELHVGVGKVFWGVTESLHLVDIINQTDLVENPDGEEKLGQPMINLALVKEWGTIDLFLMSGFRERTFPGKTGRFRSIPFVDTDHAIFEAKNKQAHVDWAVRYSHAFGDWDVGLYHFSGTSREPLLAPVINRNLEVVLVPIYNLIDQTSIDVQSTKGAWLLKLEAITRSGQGERFFASVSGVEYTFNGVFSTQADVGIIMEYLYDDRGNKAATPFEDDLFVGMRVAFNDTQDTDLLAGMIIDLSRRSRTFSVEANHRINDNLQASLQGQIFENTRKDVVLDALRDDDNVRLDLKYYY